MPANLTVWLASTDRDDPALQRFAGDVALVVEHGLAPRAAVAGILRAVADDLAAETRDRETATGERPTSHVK